MTTNLTYSDLQDHFPETFGGTGEISTSTVTSLISKADKRVTLDTGISDQSSDRDELVEAAAKALVDAWYDRKYGLSLSSAGINKTRASASWDEYEKKIATFKAYYLHATAASTTQDFSDAEVK